MQDAGRSWHGPGGRRRWEGRTRPVFVAKDDLENDVMGDELTEKSRAITQSVTPLGSYEADLEDVLLCNNLWDVLKPMPSPLKEDDSSMGFVSNRDRVAISSLFHGSSDSIGASCGGASIYDAQEEICVPISAWAYRAGARKEVWFNPKTVRAAIVTCGVYAVDATAAGAMAWRPSRAASWLSFQKYLRTAPPLAARAGLRRPSK